MVNPVWAAYVAMATGVIGAVAGIAGAVMGWVSRRKTLQIKAFDLRVELRKGVSDVRHSFANLESLVQKVNGSHMATLAAKGMSRSGASDA